MNSSSEFPTHGCLVGLDYGSKRVGVAVCDSGQSIGTPLKVLQQDHSIIRHLKGIAEEYAATGLVVGLPVHMSGDEGEKAKLARQFGTEVATALGLPIVYHDERFTSKQADSAMAAAGLSRDKRKARIDMVAAQLMLQAFLDSDRTETPPPSLS
ncbi:MAG: Holliday junction resolvase RuvX [Planctomycetaceae bacterium]